jgi:hypothetical protein
MKTDFGQRLIGNLEEIGARLAIRARNAKIAIGTGAIADFLARRTTISWAT